MFKKENQKGFTIIEVLIVLAIAGLIMLVVFLAVPALQRNARNTARTSDASLFAASINQCITNNNGKIDNCKVVTTGAGTGISFTGTEFSQLTVRPQYTDDASRMANGTGAATNRILYGIGYKCDGSQGVPGGARQFAVLYRTEGGGSSSTLACVQG